MVDSVISEAINLCLENWTALKLAVDMGWGEEEDKEKFKNELKDYILQFEVVQDDIRNFIEDVMESKFSVILEDDSADDISRILLNVYQEHMRGLSQEISKLRSLQSADTENSVKSRPPTNLVQQIQDLQVEAPALVPLEPVEPLVDEDGFETVVSKKHKKNK